MKRTIWLVCFLLLFSFAARAEYSGEIESEELIKTTASWNGRILPVYPPGQPEITILRIKIPPQAQLPVHKHPVINAGVLLKGKLTVITENGKQLHLEAGDPISEVVDTWHWGKNEGDKTAEIIVFYAGRVGMPVTIKK